MHHDSDCVLIWQSSKSECNKRLADVYTFVKWVCYMKKIQTIQLLLEFAEQQRFSEIDDELSREIKRILRSVARKESERSVDELSEDQLDSVAAARQTEAEKWHQHIGKESDS